MKKIFFILCVTMFCYGCADNNQQNRESENNEEAILIATITKNVDTYIKESGVSIKDYGGVKEFKIKQTIYDYDVYEHLVIETQMLAYDALIADVYPISENGMDTDDELDFQPYLNKDLWFTELLYSIERDAISRQMSKECFVYVHIYECKIDCSHFLCDDEYINATLVIDVILDENFNVNMLCGFDIYQGDKRIYTGW